MFIQIIGNFKFWSLFIFQLFASRRRVRLFLLDAEDEDDDEQADAGQTDNKDNSRDVTCGTDDSLNVANADSEDENKENSSDMTVDTWLQSYYIKAG